MPVARVADFGPTAHYNGTCVYSDRGGGGRCYSIGYLVPGIRLEFVWELPIRTETSDIQPCFFRPNDSPPRRISHLVVSSPLRTAVFVSSASYRSACAIGSPCCDTSFFAGPKRAAYSTGRLITKRAMRKKPRPIFRGTQGILESLHCSYCRTHPFSNQKFSLDQLSCF